MSVTVEVGLLSGKLATVTWQKVGQGVCLFALLFAIFAVSLRVQVPNYHKLFQIVSYITTILKQSS